MTKWLLLWTYLLVGLGVAAKSHEVHCEAVDETPAVCSRIVPFALVFWPVLVGHSMDVSGR